MRDCGEGTKIAYDGSELSEYQCWAIYTTNSHLLAISGCAERMPELLDAASRLSRMASLHDPATLFSRCFFTLLRNRNLRA